MSLFPNKLLSTGISVFYSKLVHICLLCVIQGTKMKIVIG